MYLPPNMTETQVLDAIDKAVGLLAPSFVFGCYDVDDIKQEGRLFALEALPRYDGVRPLENFIYSHVKNRLLNLKRDKFRRTDPPCLVCHAATGNRTEHPDGQFCKKYLAWKTRNGAKASLMRPVDLGHSSDDSDAAARTESDAEEIVEKREILTIIDANLDVSLRAAYLQMRAGETVSKTRRTEVEEAIKEILADYLHSEETNDGE